MLEETNEFSVRPSTNHRTQLGKNQREVREHTTKTTARKQGKPDAIASDAALDVGCTVEYGTAMGALKFLNFAHRGERVS